MDCKGLLRMPMKLGKSRLPVRNPELSPSKRNCPEDRRSRNTPDSGEDEFSGVDGARSWAMPTDADATTANAARRTRRVGAQPDMGTPPCYSTWKINPYWQNRVAT